MTSGAGGSDEGSSDDGDVQIGRRRRVRSWVSAVLIALGTVAFWAAMTLPLVVPDLSGFSFTDSFTVTFGGPGTSWSKALTSPPLLPLVVVGALAPLLWMLAAWVRSAWSRVTGAVFCGVASIALIALAAVDDWLPRVVNFGTVTVRSAGAISMSGANPNGPVPVGMHPAAGLCLWTVAAMLLTAAFVALPPPRRPLPGERLDPAVVRTARRRMATVFSIAAVIGTARLFGVIVEPAPDQGWLPRVGLPALDLADGTSLLGGIWQSETLWFIVVALLLLPVAFTLALRWRRLRFLAALLGAAALAGILVGCATGSPAIPPIDQLAGLALCATPALFIAASLLLPPRPLAKSSVE